MNAAARKKTAASSRARVRASSGLEGGAPTRFFHGLTPERILAAVETEGILCTGRCLALNSLENRVYDVEIELDDAPASPSDRFRVVKFYRPGRWSREQVLEEHSFLLDLVSREIPVVAPLELAGGRTLGEIEDLGILYAVFPRAQGRLRDEIDEDEAFQLGRLVARVHAAGAARAASSRLRLDVDTYGRANLALLLETGVIPATYRDRYRSLVDDVCDRAEPWLAQTDYQCIHGDCHLGNVLWGRDGAMLVDFDDMLVGPCVQDVWLLAAGRDAWARKRRTAIVEGYEEMRDFDRLSLRLVEPLRVLRLVHFCAWIARRWEDAAFPRTFPDFGSDRFWVGQIEAIQEAAACEDPFEEDYDR
ncbi:MAG TPA: serine/threonine protein kinase [Candidatus Binatia bacterium]|jgi:Ser/Thr protein kinase RdoA (MazF antagonist)